MSTGDDQEQIRDGTTAATFFQKYQIFPETVMEFEGRVEPTGEPQTGEVVFPVRDAFGHMVGSASWQPESEVYRYSSGFVEEGRLFNIDRAVAVGENLRHLRRIVIVVEDILSCLKVHQAGHPNVVALMSSTMSDAQEADLISRFSHVWLMLDGDDEGWASTQALVSRLATEFFVKAAVLPSQKKPAQLPVEVIQAILGAL